MATGKTRSGSTGAEFLADLMRSPSQEKVTHTLALADLQNAPAEWNFFRPLPESKMFELIASIEESGLLVPLIVWERSEGDYVLLSGHNRKQALTLLAERTGDPRYLSAPCIVYEKNALSTNEARSIVIDCNWVARTLSTAEKARSVYTKYVELGRLRRGDSQGKRRYDIVAEHFGLKATQAYQYYKLAQLEGFWLDKIDAGELTIKAAVHLCALDKTQRAFLQERYPLTREQIFSINKRMSPLQMENALQGRLPEEMQELRVMVPKARYAEISAMVARALRDG